MVGYAFEVGNRLKINDNIKVTGTDPHTERDESGQRFLTWYGDLNVGDKISLEAFTSNLSYSTLDGMAIFVSK